MQQLKTTMQVGPVKITKEILLDVGRGLWAQSYGRTSDDAGAFVALVDWAERTGNVGLAATLRLPSDQITALGAARWVDQGAPSIVIGHKYAAALMATQLPPWALASFRLPWRSMVIELPDGMLPVMGERGELSLRRVMLQEIETAEGLTYQYVAHTDDTTTIWAHGVAIGDLAAATAVDAGTWEGLELAAPLEDQDKRTQAMLGRLMVNVALALTDPANVRAHASCGSVGSVGKGAREPKFRQFKLIRDVKVDARQAIDDYVKGRTKGGRGPLSVASLVRGHWKPKLAERIGRPVWIEPYWRGPEDAPVAFRSHKMEGT